MRLKVQETFERAGLRTFTAASADNALKILVEHGKVITALFIDLRLPGEFGGLRLARLTAARWPHIGIVASSTCWPEAGELPEGARFILNPFSAGLVRAHLQELLPVERRSVAG